MAGKDTISKIAVWLIFLSILFLSCQSAPRVAGTVLEEAGFLPLEKGASFYIMADVKQMRPILKRLPIEELNDRQTRQMLERTNYLAAALFPKGSGRRFQLAAWGNYPVFQAGFALTFDKDWEKRRSQAGGSYWYSKSNRLSLAIGSRQAFASASLNDEPFDPLSTTAGMEIPEGFVEFRRNAAGISSPFSCWLETPNIAINRVMNDLGFPLRSPVQKLFINLFPIQEEKYEAAIRLQFENASHARAMAAILNLAVGLLSGDPNSIIASILFANPPALNGSNIDIKTAVLNEEEIIQLLGIFMFI